MAITTIGTAGIADNTITGAKVALASQAAGDVMYYNGTDWVRVGVGTDGQVLTVNNAENAPGWEAASAGATLSGSTNNTVVTVTGSNAMIGESNLTFSTDLTITSGNVVIGTAGKGIDFSAQTASSTGTVGDEVLDHYEEGTFTPALIADSTSVVATASVEVGFYTRIGHRVFYTIALTITSLGSVTTNQAARIKGLPFSASTATEYSEGSAVRNFSSMSLGVAGYGVYAGVGGSNSVVNLFLNNSTASTAALQVSNFTAAGHIILSGSYIAA